MSKSLSAAELEAKVVRFLLVRGEPCDFATIRHGAGLAQLARGDLWAAIRSLIVSRLVSYAYRVEATTYEGFEQSMSYPIFWVDRDALVKDRAVAGPAAEWWGSYLTPLNGEGVRP